MKSLIAEKIESKYEPVALLFSDAKPEEAHQFKEGAWGCIMFLLAAAANGKTAAADRRTFGCVGGGTGIGFGNQYKNFPGGEECFCYFLSTGNDQWEQGRQQVEQVKPFMRGEALQHFIHGERYLKTPEQVRYFVDHLPVTEIPSTYVVFKPLSQVQPEKESPAVIVFLAGPDQLSALTILANYGRMGNDNVIFPFAAGCMTIGIYPFQESRSPQPRAVVGLNDISARLYLRRQLKEELLSFAVPFNMYLEMEANVPGSFLEGDSWQQLLALRKTYAAKPGGNPA
jgi:uncharacterized protein (DUF169 family)